MSAETYATFAKGDVVEAVMTTRHLNRGETYKVFRFVQGGEVTSRIYWVSDSKGELYPVRNGHLTLKAVAA